MPNRKKGNKKRLKRKNVDNNSLQTKLFSYENNYFLFVHVFILCLF